jgi:UDP-glucose 4-epimerase
MRVLVTGGAGFIGSHLVDALLERGDEVEVVDDLSSGREANLDGRAALHRLDVGDPAVAELVDRWRPEVVCHLAGQVSVSRSVADPAGDADVNLTRSLRLLVAACLAGSRFVFASSGGAIYGETSSLPTSESHPAEPESPYGVAKLAFEHYLRCFGARRGLSYAALRYANVYGPRQNAEGEAGVVASFCQALASGRRPVVHGDGRQTRDFVFVEDVVRANLLAIDSGASGRFNVGTGRETSVIELLGAVAAEMGREAEPLHGPERPGDLRRSALDPALIGEALGWVPRVGLADGIARTAGWFAERA